MSLMERLKRWGQTLWAIMKAAEEGPYEHTHNQIADLKRRVERLESDRMRQH